MTTANPSLLLPSRQKSALILTAVCIVVVVGLSIGFHNQIKHQLNAWKLLPEPEHLTELYFTNPNNLPSTYAPGASQTVRFTAHNIEYRTETYQYKILETNQAGNQSQQLASGQFTLGQNQRKSLTVSITPVNLGTKTQITVALSPVNETISYWTGASL